MANGSRRVFGRRRSNETVDRRPPIPSSETEGSHPTGANEPGISSTEDLLKAMDRITNGLENEPLLQEKLNAEFNRRRQQLERFVANHNAKPLGGAKVAPFAMFPWELWQKQCAPFLLVSCHYFAVDPWNTALLPTDERGVLVLDLPMHPRNYPQGYLEACEKNVNAIRSEFLAKHDAIAAKLEKHELSALNDYTAAVKEAQTKIYAYAHTMFSILFSEDAYKRHNQVFGRALSHSIL